MLYTKDIAIVQIDANNSIELVTHTHISASTLHTNVMRLHPDMEYITQGKLATISRRIGRIKSPLRMSVKDRRAKYSK